MPATFPYNAGDQLASSPYGSGYVYDTYGNLDVYTKTGGGSVNLDYDSFDHTIRIDDSTTRVDSVLSPDGRVLRRTVSSPPGVTITEDRWYGYTDSSDSPAWSQATSGGAYTTYLSNLIVTGTTPSYQLSDPKGTVVGTVTQAGAFTATPVPDEYGNVATVPASRLDWLGTQKRFVDHPGLDIVRMGVRAYDPHLGRFLSQDPIAGGSANDYDYVNADPINNLDLGGTRCAFGVKSRTKWWTWNRRHSHRVQKTVETCNGVIEITNNTARAGARGARSTWRAVTPYLPRVGQYGMGAAECTAWATTVWEASQGDGPHVAVASTMVACGAGFSWGAFGDPTTTWRR